IQDQNGIRASYSLSEPFPGFSLAQRLEFTQIEKVERCDEERIVGAGLARRTHSLLGAIFETPCEHFFGICVRDRVQPMLHEAGLAVPTEPQDNHDSNGPFRIPIDRVEALKVLVSTDKLVATHKPPPRVLVPLPSDLNLNVINHRVSV